ncbi:SepM family pheromone-processing serine protease [Risungbinella massiliensis]|uniref:SepM family pheromone-processing serine protease n=1 Tax=Risungbinella massiliensis TaxID=1329796 RepID=UPI0005CB8091|nr:SepM family pheromone-processing serine protease [Risungbinella massiliensis]
MTQALSKRRIISFSILFILFILIGIGFLVPIPYYVMKPGSAMDVEPYVQVEVPQKDENGKFYLTTISLQEGSVIDYLIDRFSDQIELIPNEQLLAPGETDEEYEREQRENMEESQHFALISAFQYTKQPIRVEKIGLEVFRILEGVRTGLQPRDLIQKVDNQAVTSVEGLSKILQGKQVGEKVPVTLVRKGKSITVEVPVIELPGKPNEPKRHGFGFTAFVKTSVTTTPKAKIQTENIGGPSAGLMFTLETIDQLLPENLTNGYQVSGTGTIDDKGNVGQIGGIQYKVMAADRQGAHIFFTPKDIQPHDNNEKIAKETAKKIGTKMEIVPVANVQEAIEYLKKKPYYPAVS